MSKPKRRYIFIDFEDLKKVKFKKLEKVCDKVFVFINEEETHIPFELVQQMQALGKGVKWISIPQPITTNFNYHICFLMGKLHQKVDKQIEFAILSNDKSFDPLVNFINTTSRSCLRVKRKKDKKEASVPMNAIELPSSITSSDEINQREDQQPFFLEQTESEVVENTAKETVNRLIRSGNRPAGLDMLKNYILLHNQELTIHGSNLDEIIDHLQETKEISIEQGEVIYNF
ncbi:MAG: PIN domain-containing protein [Saprospiraceae bacterium]